ncbi:zinc-dependent peptidase [Massilia arenosa]|uniref:Zinc-dependent peptidase n=1 Tax=Zemynaea arenosa TaxID=2561931 RepID=A0A4Y9SC42_9BURK|nr:M90 family metallopeptidase [Massilia arenosa]TFW17926.1 zinc-dependent peptidase [Massilia arenosa]
MDALFVLAALGLAGGAALLWPRWRLRRALAAPMDPAQVALIRRNLPLYDAMPPELQQQLKRMVRQFLHQKTFIGCAGLEVTDEMRYTVAAHACLLLLNRPSRVYPRLTTILMYPTEFLVPRREADAAGVITETRQGLLGESWGDGRVVLSWDHVQQAARAWGAAPNVVLHEFAHQLDSESGSTNGAPYLGNPQRYESWSTVLSREYQRLRRDAMYGQQGVLDHYGASNPAEFFAVAVETYFTKPWQLADEHAELYAEFQEYFRVDPRAWLPEPRPAPVPEWNFAYGQWQ